MLAFAILASIAFVVVLCRTVFTLAIFALPVCTGTGAGLWAGHTGAGSLAAFGIGLAVAAIVLVTGRLLLAARIPAWSKGLVVFAFVAPAAFAGYCATLGLVRHLVFSEPAQLTISAIGALAVAATALTRFTAMTAPGHSGQGAVMPQPF